MKKTHKYPAARGFTLVELLVVIVIIAILIALLFPYLRHARDPADQAVCAQQLRDLSVVINLYMADHAGRYPYGSMRHPNDAIWDWTDLVGRSHDGRNLSLAAMNAQWLTRNNHPHQYNDKYLCPAEFRDVELRTINNDGVPRNHYTISYRINTAIGPPGMTNFWDPADGRPWGIARGEVAVTASQIPRPASLIVLAERRWVNHPLGGNYSTINSPADQLDPQLQNRGWTYLHGRGKKSNYLFADGHVESHEPRNTYGTGTLTRPGGIWTRRVDD